MGQYWNGSRGDCKSKDLKANRHINIQSSSNFNLGLKLELERELAVEVESRLQVSEAVL